jgi:hypothetical protein
MKKNFIAISFLAIFITMLSGQDDDPHKASKAFEQAIFGDGVNEMRMQRAIEDEKRRQEFQREQEARQQAQLKKEQERKQYAESLGCLDYIDEGLLVTQAQITPSNFELAKKMLIIPDSNDTNYRVSSTTGQYIVYMAVIHGVVYQIALIADQGLTYPSGSHFDIKSVYQITGTQKFTKVLGGDADIIVIKRLGNNPF